MILQTDKSLIPLRNKQKIKPDDLIYARRTDGKIGWCRPSKETIGQRWLKFHPYTPSIILRFINP